MATEDDVSCATISFSQEEKLRRSGFRTDSDSSDFSIGDDEPVDLSDSATPIVMESPPASPQQGAAANGQFETLAENFDSVAVAVEPGHDAADLGVSSEPKESGVHKRGSCSDSDAASLKKPKLTPSESLAEKAARLGKPPLLVELIKLFEKLVSESAGDIGVGETAQNVVEAGGDSGGTKTGKTKRSLKQDLLAMIEGTMRVTGQLPPLSGATQPNSKESGAQHARSIVEIAKSRGMKFPKPDHWPPGKEL